MMFRTLPVILLALVFIGTVGAATKILGSADGETPGHHIDVTQLKRIHGNMVLLKFVLVNGSNALISMGDFLAGSTSDAGTIADVYLDDGASKYVVTRDGDVCRCSSHIQNLWPKAKYTLWAEFPAPPTSITKLNVVVPHFPPVEDVPLTPL